MLCCVFGGKRTNVSLLTRGSQATNSGNQIWQQVTHLKSNLISPEVLLLKGQPPLLRWNAMYMFLTTWAMCSSLLKESHTQTKSMVYISMFWWCINIIAPQVLHEEKVSPRPLSRKAYVAVHSGVIFEWLCPGTQSWATQSLCSNVKAVSWSLIILQNIEIICQSKFLFWFHSYFRHCNKLYTFLFVQCDASYDIFSSIFLTKKIL